jgi:undecaprenyl-diphosphatase
MDWLMPRITHIGGAVFSLSFLLIWWVVMDSPLSHWAVEALVSLTASHLVVEVLKTLLHRDRPYQKLVPLHPSTDPLKDYSFPSGHTTAIFSIVVVFILHVPWTGIFLIPLAVLVGLSRMYLGLHYPTDVVVGASLGTGFAVGVYYSLSM